MKKSVKVVIVIIAIFILLFMGLVIWINYNERKDLQVEHRKTIVLNIVNDILGYCGVEDFKSGQGITFERLCTDGDNIIKNISDITDIDPFEKILDLDYDGLVNKIELKYKKQKYVYVRNAEGKNIIITNLDDYSYENNNGLNDKQENKDDINKDGVVDEVSVDNELVKSLYNKYISYATYETNNYKNINVNESNSDEYLVKHAIYKILEDNKINIKDYLYNSDDEDSSYSTGYKNGYKISTDKINQYIKDNFNIERTIDFDELDLNFINISEGKDNADISYYYFSNENSYRLISDSSIPKTGAGNVIKYSKYKSYEVIGDELIIYTDFFIVVDDMGISYINSNMDNCKSLIDEIDNNSTQYILNNHSDKIGNFKHTFKKINGIYYWVETTQTN